MLKSCFLSAISCFQTVNIHMKKDSKGKTVNNQVMNWSFKVDGLLYNASQEQVLILFNLSIQHYLILHNSIKCIASKPTDYILAPTVCFTKKKRSSLRPRD